MMPLKIRWSLIGVLLALAAYAAAALWVARRTSARTESVTTLRVSHWLLETGYREAFAEIGRAWEQKQAKAGRAVRFEQIVVPTRVYAAWMRTNLVGGTAPDLVYVKRENGATDELMARYFEPIDSEASAPNPYNAGTPLADASWRNTFIDGLAVTGTSPGLADIYAIPTSATSIRLYFNPRLLEQITGLSTPPRDWTEFLAVCEEIARWREQGQHRVVPIAGSRVNATLLFNLAVGGLAQSSARQIDRRGDLGTGPAELLVAAQHGDWKLADYTLALRAVQELGRYMQPGFLQMQREDATMLFGQQQAVMIVAGSWTANSLHAELPFTPGVAELPLPSPSDPQWGGGVRGAATDNAGLMFEGFALPRAGKQRELALDFLRFLSSQEVYARYAELSGCLPVVKGVTANDRMRPFQLRRDGFRPGVPLNQVGEATRRLWDQNLQDLLPPSGSVDRFTQLLAAHLPATLAQDLDRWRRSIRTSVELQDFLLEARHQLSAAGEIDLSRRDTLLDSQAAAESAYYASFFAPTSHP